MKKEEFPTFLNEQPTVVFGRTARELLFMALGAVAGFSVWGNVEGLIHGSIGFILGIIAGGITVLFALVVALIPIASRPLEEWIMILVLYQISPRVFLYKPQEETVAVLEATPDGMLLLQEGSHARTLESEPLQLEGATMPRLLTQGNVERRTTQEESS